MKATLTLILTFLIGLASVPVPESGTHDRKAGIPRTHLSEFDELIENFWEASLAGDKVRLNDLVSRAPANYYEMYNKCSPIADNASGADIASSDSDENLIYLTEVDQPIEKFLNSSRSNYLLARLQDSAAQIRENNYSDFRILDTRKFGNHGIARIQYGKKNQLFSTGYILLAKENEGWRIFFFTGGYDLSFDNKYFAQSTCDETPITELSWTP